ncbi:Hypothetical predicted protein [Mytilus galloprovincialis]|uniref:Uncharacterized protein n=1 Tax=Mytilus galloprovincialis TaxID=29158 RepID=A0A8B6CF51_MYTGA|nr:Hypothetical predicted protein [Mytilus galloprovincialis]
MFNRHLRKWLGVPKSFSSIGLYNTSSKLQLPLSSITEDFKVTKTRQVMMLIDSKDDKQPLWQSADARHRRKLGQQEVRRGEEEDRQVRAVSMKQQGQYIKWEMAQQRKISWHEMWRMDGRKISFLLRSVYDVYQPHKPYNVETIEDLVTALKEWVDTLRHDQVLREID